MVEVATLAALLVVAFAGGAFGAAIGALPAFSFAGLVIVVGEAANVVQGSVAATGPLDPAALGATGLTGSLGLGPGLGPHTAFAGGAAAAAYAARQGHLDTGFDYHEAKNITYALGTRPDVLAVGGVFGALGFLVTGVSVGSLGGAGPLPWPGLPWDPIAASIVATAFLHRIAFGYPLVGEVRDGLFDMSPFERGERREPRADGSGVEADSGVTPADPHSPDTRFVVEPWLPHQYEWPNVVTLGAVVGIFAAFTTYRTGSPFLAFGLTAASLVFLNLGMEKMPVTHHMALPASIAVVGVAGAADPSLVDGTTYVAPSALAEAVSMPVIVIVGGVFGAVAGVAGEAAQRALYAHADTHLDPPAAAIVVTTFLIALLDVLGLFAQNVVPTVGL